ncbi:MAG: 50S ribosomal protein L29 [Nitrospinota bacterium]|jgi:large subunit ribosomal protein L29|nr:50S ribosomal protein L29 [Nitrospinota bacterium]
MKMQEIKELSEKERDEKLNDLREEYFNLKFQLAMGKIENPGRLKYMRRDIARIMTLKIDQPKAEAAEAKEEQGSKKTADKK